MRSLLGLNAALAFLLELALLAAAVAIGLLLPAPLPVRVAAAVLLPAAVILVWALLVAPRARRRLADEPRLLLQVALFAAAVAGLAALGALWWAVALAVLVAARTVLGARLGRI
ncbi:DUF2568 domain-containing protein [uncultured Amnibacterium sp.]|uniref:DUF2568 domain-containing protein n=1 Tax=uncultured Amnibacterium sp. TaxID=1631851 RepID=UPI0035CB7854